MGAENGKDREMGGSDQIQEIIRRENWQDLVRIVLALGSQGEEVLMMTLGSGPDRRPSFKSGRRARAQGGEFGRPGWRHCLRSSWCI